MSHRRHSAYLRVVTHRPTAHVCEPMVKVDFLFGFADLSDKAAQSSAASLGNTHQDQGKMSSCKRCGFSGLSNRAFFELFTRP